MPGILIQTDDVEKFAKLMHAVLPNVDISDKELSLQIDGDRFDDYPTTITSAIPLGLESLETSEDCSRPYPGVAFPQHCTGLNCNSTDGTGHSPECIAQHNAAVSQAVKGERFYQPPLDAYPNPEAKSREELFSNVKHGVNDPGSSHTVHAPGPSMTLYDQIQVLKNAYRGLRMWNMGADGVADMLAQHGIKVIERDKDNIEFANDFALMPIRTEGIQQASQNQDQAATNVANYHWALARVVDYRHNDLAHKDRFGDGDIARLICKVIEEAETLEHSELYRNRIAGISTAAMGYAPKSVEECCADYVTPALRDAMKLYCEYDKAHQVLQSVGFYKNGLGHWTPQTAEDPAIAQLADIYQERAEQSADSVIASLQAECGKLRQELEELVGVAKGHGWGPAQGALPSVLKRWLDEFVAAVQSTQYQSGQIKNMQDIIDQVKLELRETSREATNYADTCGRLRKELAQLQVYVSQGGMNDKVLNLGGAGGQTPGAAGQPGQHRVYNPLIHG